MLSSRKKERNSKISLFHLALLQKLTHRLSKQILRARVITTVEKTIQLISLLQLPSTPVANSIQLDLGGSRAMTSRFVSAFETAADCKAGSSAIELERREVGDSFEAAVSRGSGWLYFCASNEAAAGAVLAILKS